MQKKIAGIILVSLLLAMSIMGCQQAAKKPFTDDTDKEIAGEMTENERRVLAGRLSNMAEEVEGVKKASVVISSIGMTQDNTTVPKTTTENVNTGTAERTTMPANPGTTDINTPVTPKINTPGITSNTNKRTDVNDNTVNQTGLVVMVGITLDDNIKNDKDRMDAIKQKVADRLQGADTRISQVLVTGDPDLIKRINNVASGLLKGEPLNNFAKDIKNLGRDLQKEMPAF